MSARCKTLLLPEGAKASLIYGNLITLTLFAFAKLTKVGRSMSFHPFAIISTVGFVAPFWIVGEKSVIDCMRGAYDTRKSILGENYKQEKFNQD
jgi:hypothetical protein